MFRFAALASVSTDEQATDHDSLTNQINDIRAYAVRLGGLEACGPFVLDGYSRSYYEGLSDAMGEIPPLREAVQAAEHNEYDVLFVRYFDRLGELAHPLNIRFRKLKKQLRSIQEPSPIFPPAEYDPSKDDTTSTLIALSSIKQTYRINRIVNNLRENMPKRIRDGLTPSRVPYGYRWTSPKTPPELQHDIAAKIIQARDLLMTGRSYAEIGRLLDCDHSAVAYILGNPYYAGQVIYNKGYIVREGVKSRYVELPQSRWTVGQGKHEAIFTLQEHEAIAAELERRRLDRHRSASRYPYSGLLVCDACNGVVRRGQWGQPPRRLVYYCRAYGAKHYAVDMAEVNRELALVIRDELEREHNGEMAVREDKSELYRKGLAENEKKRARVQEGYETGLYTSREAAARLKTLEGEGRQLQADLERSEMEKQGRLEAGAAMGKIDWRYIPQWLEQDDPRKVNRLLTAWLKEIRLGEGIRLVKR